MQRDLSSIVLGLKRSYRLILSQIQQLDVLSNGSPWVQYEQMPTHEVLAHLRMTIKKFHNELLSIKQSKPTIADASPIPGISVEMDRLYKGSVLYEQLSEFKSTFLSLTPLTFEWLTLKKEELAKLKNSFKDVQNKDLSKKRREEFLFQGERFNNESKQLEIDIDALILFCTKQPIVLTQRTSPNSKQEIISDDQFLALLEQIRTHSKISKDLKVHFRKKVEEKYKWSKVLLEKQVEQARLHEVECCREIQDCRAQISVFSLVINDEKQPLRSPIFTRERLTKLTSKIDLLTKEVSAWQVSDVRAPEIKEVESAYNESLSRLTEIIYQRLKVELRAKVFNERKGVMLLNYYQQLRGEREVLHKDEGDLGKLRKQLFWRSYERRLFKLSFWDHKRSFWLGKRKNEVSWEDIISHAKGKNKGYSGARTKQTLLSLGWMDQHGQLTHEASWILDSVKPISERVVLR